MKRIIAEFRGDHAFLSNFQSALVTLDGETFPTVENAYQAAKVQPHRRAEFRIAKPGFAKRLARTMGIRDDWEDVKEQIMLDLLRQKFATEPLRSQLLATEDAVLIEGNSWNDTFWGVCNGEGQNKLGELLMQVRAELSGESHPLGALRLPASNTLRKT